jgi:hypothetical protein
VRVSGDLVGRALSAVLAPPQAQRFTAITGTDPGTLTVSVTGWSKLALIGPDRVFLFPRAARTSCWPGTAG